MMSSPRAVLAMCLLLLGSAPALGAAPIVPHAALVSSPVTFNVNSLNDAVADFTGDPNFDICRTNSANNTCTLRAAIMNANRHLGSATINLPPGTYQLSILPIGIIDDAHGSLDFSHTVTLAGAGAAGTIVDGAGLDRVFFLASTAVVTMTGITIQHGHAFAGGAILSRGQLNLANTILSGNAANSDGGGLLNTGTATIRQTTVESNTADIDGDGGGVNNLGTLTIDTSTLSDNSALHGGAVANNGGNLTLFDSTLSNNSAAYEGGGLYNLNAGTASIFHTTIAGNLADNRATGSYTGGGIFNLASGNSVQIWNSVLAYNFASHFDSQCAGPLYSQDYNYIALNGSCPLNGTTTHNLKLGDPLLGPLADNGGPTWTRALGTGSVVADQIPLALCRDQFGSAPVPDQRGVPRPVGPLCDMGAYEGTQATPIYLHNLIRNGDAEASAGSPIGAFVGVADWLNGTFFGPRQPTQLTVVTYNATGGFPSVPTDTVPVNHGANFFAGGYVTTSIGSQVVVFDGITSALDAGMVRYVFSADLGGFGSQDDKAAVTMQFANQIGSVIGTVTLDGPNASGRANHTGFLHVTQTGPVPANARGAYIMLTLTRASGPGTYNDGYADNISLVLLPPTLFLPLVRN